MPRRQSIHCLQVLFQVLGGHIHPDHSSAKTLSKLNKDIPVLIHNFPEKFLKNKIESLGFKTIELEHGVRISLKNNLHINIMAADNCDPNICGQIMGCGLAEVKFKTHKLTPWLYLIMKNK